MSKTQKETEQTKELPVLDGQLSLDDVISGIVETADGDLADFKPTFRSEVT